LKEKKHILAYAGEGVAFKYQEERGRIIAKEKDD